MNKLRQTYWLYGVLPLTLGYILTVIIWMFFGFDGLGSDQCQFLWERQIVIPDCFYTGDGGWDNCPKDVGNLGCPKFVEAKYYGLVSLVVASPIFLVVWNIWSAIRVFRVSKPEASVLKKLATGVSVMIVPIIFIVFIIALLLIADDRMWFNRSTMSKNILDFDNISIWGAD